MKKPTCFTAQFDLQLAHRLREDLLQQGFELSHPPYTLFSAKKPGISCTLYASGKLTVQGKEKDAFIEFYLEPQLLKTFTYTHPVISFEPRIGMDEAGKGDFFGPLCVAALYADATQIQMLQDWGVQDSKRFSDRPLLALAEKIRKHCSYTVIRLFPQKYNELYAKMKNLNRLLAWMHTAALQELFQKTGCKRAILDQFADPSLVQKNLEQKNLPIELEQKVRAEEDLVVAAASILARSAFLQGLETLSEEYAIPLPKGASSIVIETGKKLLWKFGPEVLPHVAKTHFKTMQQLKG